MPCLQRKMRGRFSTHLHVGGRWLFYTLVIIFALFYAGKTDSHLSKNYSDGSVKN